MNITTTYKTNANGTGQVVAKSGGKQKTVAWDHSKSTAWNHGTAAGAFLIQHQVALILPPPMTLARRVDSGMISHDSNDAGTVHRFSL